MFLSGMLNPVRVQPEILNRTAGEHQIQRRPSSAFRVPAAGEQMQAQGATNAHPVSSTSNGEQKAQGFEILTFPACKNPVFPAPPERSFQRPTEMRKASQHPLFPEEIRMHSQSSDPPDRSKEDAEKCEKHENGHEHRRRGNCSPGDQKKKDRNYQCDFKGCETICSTSEEILEHRRQHDHLSAGVTPYHSTVAPQTIQHILSMSNEIKSRKRLYSATGLSMFNNDSPVEAGQSVTTVANLEKSGDGDAVNRIIRANAKELCQKFYQDILTLNPRISGFLHNRLTSLQLVRFERLLAVKAKHEQWNEERIHNCITVVLLTDFVINSSDKYSRTQKNDRSLPITSTGECQVCYQNIGGLKTAHQMELHIYNDLQPFACTWANCSGNLQRFKSKEIWTAHERKVHENVDVWICDYDKCNYKIRNPNKFMWHLSTHGESKVTHDRIKLCSETKKPPEIRGCEFCTDTFSDIKGMKLHHASHMVEISLLACQYRDEVDHLQSQKKDDLQLDTRHRTSEVDISTPLASALIVLARPATKGLWVETKTNAHEIVQGSIARVTIERLLYKFRSDIVALNPTIDDFLVNRLEIQQLARLERLLSMILIARKWDKERVNLCVANVLNYDIKSRVSISLPGVPPRVWPKLFECPICFQLQSFRYDSEWMVHFYRDLLPFSCIRVECPRTDSFGSKQNWASHENGVHDPSDPRVCSLCGSTFHHEDHFLSHFPTEHGQQLPSRGEVRQFCRTIKECPFCQHSLTPKDVRYHLASHMEKIAAVGYQYIVWQGR